MVDINERVVFADTYSAWVRAGGLGSDFGEVTENILAEKRPTRKQARLEWHFGSVLRAYRDAKKQYPSMSKKGFFEEAGFAKDGEAMRLLLELSPDFVTWWSRDFNKWLMAEEEDD
jgi:hypothetical protein